MSRPFPVSASLTAIAIGYRNTANMLIADRVLPPVAVFSERFKWIEYPIKEGFRLPDNRVGRTGEVNRVDFSANEKDSSVVDYGLEAPIPISDIEEARRMRELGQSTVDPEQQAVEGIANYNLLARERRVSSLVHNPLSYAASRRIVLSGTSQFSDYVNSDPIGVIRAALEGTLIFRPNKLVMGSRVWFYLASHPKVINAVKGGLTTSGIVTKEQFAALFEGITEILVGEAYLDAAKWGQAVDLQRVWGNHIAAIHVNPQASTTSGVTFGYTATYGSAIAGRLQDPKIGLQGGVAVRAGTRERQLIVAPDVGFFIQNAVPNG
ncbi:hypothetical protein [Methylopila sp. 73B]|uniref:hypothetical protein n=1 Tax=Methylopila sp. 73B TaxID=1120792 RepID=UPI0003828B13|nr:hypothetical protein [Methylopila sp. 73B]